MFVAYLIIALLLAFGLLNSAYGKLTRNPRGVEVLDNLGVPASWVRWLAAAEIAGAVGLIAGLFYAPFGIAAAIALILYFVGAVITHLRAGDVKGVSAPTPMLLFSTAALVLGVLTVHRA
jgi:hypothetical protein